MKARCLMPVKAGRVIVVRTYRDTPVPFEPLEHETAKQVTSTRQKRFELSVLKTLDNWRP